MYLGVAAQSHAQEAPKAAPPPPGPPAVEKSYPEDFELIWNKLPDVLKERNLFEHIHGNAVLDKEKGTITTPTLRYFKIISAKAPVVEEDFRDTYIITVIKAPAGSKGTTVKVHRKFEMYDPNAKPVPTWVETDPTKLKEKVGTSGDDLLNALQVHLASLPAGQAGAAPTTPAPAPTPAAPPSASPTAPNPAPTPAAPPSAAPASPTPKP